MEYKNFDLYIESKVGETYPVRVKSETLGEADGVFTLAAECVNNADQLKNLRAIVQGINLPETFGVALHGSLFQQDVGRMLERCLGNVLADDEKGMRIRLILAPPEIAALPWEFLYDKGSKCFLSTSGKTPVTRYINLNEPIKALKTAPPVKVLVVIPKASGLNVEEEKRLILKALSGLDTVQAEVLEGEVTRDRISRALVEDEYHILHFIGHGTFDGSQGYLAINAETGGHDMISADAFADFFRTYPSLKLIVLNACQGAEGSETNQLAGVAPQLVARGIPAVIAMQYPISDPTALKFASEFYLKLCKGVNRGQVDMAISHARNRIHMDIANEPVAFATPVLFMRSDTGVIFDLQQHTHFYNPLRKLFRSSAVKNVARLKAVKKTYETNIEAWEHKTESAAPGSLHEIKQAIAQDKSDIIAVDKEIIQWNRTFLASALATLMIFLLAYVGLFNFPFHLDDWLEAKFIPYMESYVPKKFSPDVRLILAEPGENGGLGEPNWKWRQYHAPLVLALARAHAKTVVFDLQVNDATQYDPAFAEAIKTAQASGTEVVLGKALDEEGATIKDIAEDLRNAVGDRWGNIDVGALRGGVVRVYQLGQPLRSNSPASEAEVGVVPSLGLEATARFLSSGPAVKAFFNETAHQIQLRSDGALIKSIPVYENNQSLYDFPYDLAKRSRLHDATRSYQEVYARREEDPYMREYAGKIVLVGFKTADDSWDLLQGEQRFGTEIHANVISNILANVYVRLLPTSYDFLIVAVMAGCGALVQARFRHVFSAQITIPFSKHKKKIDVPGLLFALDIVYLLVAFLLYKNALIFILKSYHLAAPFIAYWLTGKMRRKASLAAT
jgi:CHASE2 domain-containing sensor protein